MGEQGKLYCSFCAKSQDEVVRLFMGVNAGICNECIGLCVSIALDQYPPAIAELPKPPTPEAK